MEERDVCPARSRPRDLINQVDAESVQTLQLLLEIGDTKAHMVKPFSLPLEEPFQRKVAAVRLQELDDRRRPTQEEQIDLMLLRAFLLFADEPQVVAIKTRGSLEISHDVPDVVERPIRRRER